MGIMMAQMANKKKNGKRFVIVGNEKYGLYFGETSATDAEVAKTHSLRLDSCRHICRWYGKTGGITSLAAFGPCGSQAGESRIGAPAPSQLLTGVVNVIDCSDEAVAAFAKVQARDA